MITMWIPTPSMSLPQRVVLYGTCVLAVLNSLGLLVLLVQQNQQAAWLERTDLRLTEVEQSSVVEFLQEVPREAAGLRANVGQHQYQYSRNKRSDQDETEEGQEVQEGTEKGHQVHEQEVSQEVGEEAERKRKNGMKQIYPHGYHKAHVQDDMMMMMTYSMVPVRISNTICHNYNTNLFPTVDNCESTQFEEADRSSNTISESIFVLNTLLINTLL